MYSKQKSLNFGHYVPNDKVLNRKIPENPKYKHVKPAIDTGKNVRKHIDELKEKQKNCNHKKDEVFKRVKVSAFIRLTLAVAIDLLNESGTVNEPSSPDKPKATESSGQRRGVANVLVGIGELDLINVKKESHLDPTKPVNLMPYLLLDVRDRDAFSQCHIITAKHYPSMMLSRSSGYEIKDMKLFKNRPSGIIIVYDDDETIGTRVATTLVERGYENVYLLTGGLKLALEICPYGLTTSSQMLTPVDMLTQGASCNASQDVEKEYFSREDIDTIQNYVEEAFPNKDNNPIGSSKSSQSRKEKSVRSFHRSIFDPTPASSCASTTSRRESSRNSSLSTDQKEQLSASSKNTRLTHTHSNCSKKMELSHLKPVIDDRTKKPKKAPWK